MNEPENGASQGAEEAAPNKKSALTNLSNALAEAKDNLTKVADGLSAIPGTSSVTGFLTDAIGVFDAISKRLGEVEKGFKDGKEAGGPIGGLLGGFSALLGPESGEVGEDGEKSSLDKVRAKVGQLSQIWNEHYKDLFDKEGKLKATKLGNLALEVGATVLGSKKMAKVRKAVAVASVVASRAEAVMKAAKSAPFPFNLPAIAFAVATGQAQENAVKGASPGQQLHDGLDYVPRTGTFLLEKGERVLGKRLNQDLKDFLNASSQADAGGSIDRSVTRTSTFNPTINLTVGGDKSDDSLIANRGAVETMIREIYADYALTSPFGA